MARILPQRGFYALQEYAFSARPLRDGIDRCCSRLALSRRSAVGSAVSAEHEGGTRPPGALKLSGNITCAA